MGEMSFREPGQNCGSGTFSYSITGPAGTVISENSSEGAYALATCQNSD